MDIGFKWDSMGKVEKIIKKWKPKRCTTEKDYEKSLVTFLQEEMPDVKIIQQYGAGTQKIDIVVGEEVAIELKKDLTTPEYQRLIGQLYGYKKNWDKIFVVVCGEIKDNLKKDLEDSFKEKQGYGFFTPDYRLIFK